MQKNRLERSSFSCKAFPRGKGDRLRWMRVASKASVLLRRVTYNESTDASHPTLIRHSHKARATFPQGKAKRTAASEIPLRQWLALFRPCHPERSRNPSEARIKRREAELGSSDEKVRFRCASLRMTRTGVLDKPCD